MNRLCVCFYLCIVSCVFWDLFWFGVLFCVLSRFVAVCFCHVHSSSLLVCGVCLRFFVCVDVYVLCVFVCVRFVCICVLFCLFCFCYSYALVCLIVVVCFSNCFAASVFSASLQGSMFLFSLIVHCCVLTATAVKTMLAT